MKQGNLVMYGWTWRNEIFHDVSGRIGLVISNIRWDEDVTVEKLYRENGIWEAEPECEDGEAVDVLWNTGSIEACSIENLVEVKKCQIGI